jgi:hypothetical protein
MELLLGKGANVEAAFNVGGALQGGGRGQRVCRAAISKEPMSAPHGAAIPWPLHQGEGVHRCMGEGGRGARLPCMLLWMQHSPAAAAGEWRLGGGAAPIHAMDFIFPGFRKACDAFILYEGVGAQGRGGCPHVFQGFIFVRLLGYMGGLRGICFGFGL